MADEADFSAERGIATEPHIRRFVKLVGGELVDELVKDPTFENADFVFRAQKVAVELKIIQTEFASSEGFTKLLNEIDREAIRVFGPTALARSDLRIERMRLGRVIEHFRKPLSRIAKKANRQIKRTKSELGLDDFAGVLWLVNDEFRSIDRNR